MKQTTTSRNPAGSFRDARRNPAIADISVVFLRYPFPRSIQYEYSGGRVENMDCALLRVTDNNGETGIGEITHGAFCYEPIIGLVEHFKRLLVGHPVLEINRIWELMYGSSVFWNRQGIGVGVMGGIDIALHDLVGKLLNVPVYQLLGGLTRSRIRTYASNGLFAEPQPLVTDAERAIAMGFTAYKMRVVTPLTIVSQVEILRAALPGLDVIVDAVQGSCAVPWAVSVSCKLAQQLERLGVMWFEEPVRVENIEGYVEVRRSTTMNIAGAESLPTALSFKPYLDRNAFSVLQFDIATSGFSEGRRIMALADAYQKPVAIHSWGSIVSALAGLHLSLVSPSCAMTEYCFMDHPLNDLLSVEKVRPVDGQLLAPQLPGLGVKFDDEIVARFRYEPGVNTMISTQEKNLKLI